ncbi:MAG: 23S rRNA (pseudouridine(1915)-N(3))-methyltransferase RlmH [Firmicutes bacterium]|nr:23S rRNA (pseudouridine(1915)-N(3))-methyltransferase RlmH [Bacillota bacterium]MCL5040236.1 23S rRNA (pseudouridine(1915)-N(3))-methyltransferase RlmH [Bacillota bacterium]
MKIKIILIGQIKESFWREGAAEYLKRLKPYTQIELISVPDEAFPEGITPGQIQAVLRLEGERARREIPPGSFIVALDRQGQQFSSEGIASWLGKRTLAGQSHFTFVIGGTLGLDQELLNESSLRLSLSTLTFPHQMVPLLLLEQIYRAFKIIRNEPYHR